MSEFPALPTECTFPDFMVCDCGVPLPCTCCAIPNQLTILDCQQQTQTVYNNVIYGATETIKSDGQQRQHCSMRNLEVLFAVPEEWAVPPRGSYAVVDGQAFRIAEVLKYGCDVVLTLRNQYMPCTQTVDLYLCPDTSYCEQGTPTYLGQIDIALFFGGCGEQSGEDYRRLEKTAYAYPTIPIGMQPFRISIDHVFAVDGVQYRVKECRDEGSIDGCEFWVVEEGNYGCVPA